MKVNYNIVMVFWHTSTWINHRNMYVPPLVSLPPPLTPYHPFRLSQSPSVSSLSHTVDSPRVSTMGF